MQWQQEQVLALAPDDASVKAAKKLTTVGKWPTLGMEDGMALWGECQGSGKTPYKTAIDLSDVAFQCSCPSRKFPCKHALALFLLYVESPAPFATQRVQPDWVESWLAGRAKRKGSQASAAPATVVPETANATTAESPLPPPQSTTPVMAPAAAPTTVQVLATNDSAKAQARRAQAREQKVAAGISELQTWLHDLVRGGYVEAQSRPYSYWQQMAARLIDAQASGLAGQVEALSSIVSSGEGWADRLTAALGKLFLLLEAYQRLAALPAPLQQDVRTLIGWHQTKEEVMAGEPVADQWNVLSHVLEEEGNLLSQRVWLQGVQSGRYALILNFAHPSNRQSLDTFWRAGIVVAATLYYYASAVPLRALATDVQFYTKPAMTKSATVERRSTAMTGLSGANISDALQEYQQQLAHLPWLTRFPLTLANVAVGLSHANPLHTAFAYDEEEHLLPISTKCKTVWQLLSITGGHPTQLFGEWLEDGLLPLGVWHEGRYWTL